MLPHRKYYNSTSFFDLLLNIALILFLMFAIAFMQIKPESKKAAIETKAEYIITVTWPKDNTDDVDPWLKDPIETNPVLHYNLKEVGLSHLDRDDRGNITDWITLANGKIIKYDYNQEIITIRGIVPGEWILNIHMFGKREKEPTPVTIKIEKLNPSVKTVFLKTVVLEYHKEEKTVTRFEMAENGDLIAFDDLPASLIPRGAP